MCVSTNVGGIPEVLPPHMINLAQPKPKPMIKVLREVINGYIKNGNDFDKNHEIVNKLYSWENTAERVEQVYNKVDYMQRNTLVDRIKM